MCVVMRLELQKHINMHCLKSSFLSTEKIMKVSLFKTVNCAFICPISEKHWT